MTETPALDQDVIAQIVPGSATLELSQLLGETLIDPEPVSLENDIFAKLGLDDSSCELGEMLRDLVEDGGRPEFTDRVMAELGLDDGLSLGDLLGPEDIPDLWADVAASIDSGTSVDELKPLPEGEATEVISFTEEKTKRRLWSAQAAVWFAAAAALLLVVADFEESPDSPGDSVQKQAPTGEQLAQVEAGQDTKPEPAGSEMNDQATASSEGVSSGELDLEQSDVIIERLDSEANAFVQVFQFDDDAPPIIFITELDDIAGDASEGATL